MTATDTSHSPRAFDLGELVAHLRLAGFRADTRQYLTAHKLILALARQGIRLDRIVDYRDAEKLTACLAPVFCHSPEEQGRFKDIVTQWLDIAEPQPAQRHRQALKAHSEKIKTTVTTRPVGAFMGIGLLVMAAVILFYYFVPVSVTGRILRIEPESKKKVPAVEARVLFENNPIDLKPGGSYTIELTRFASPGRMLVRLKGYPDSEYFIDARQSSNREIVLEPDQPQPSRGFARGIRIRAPSIISPQFVNALIVKKTDWPKAIGIPLAAWGGIFLFLILADRHRRRLVLKRLPVAFRPDATFLAEAGAPSIALSGPRLRRLVGALKRPRKEEIFELSVPRTVLATARAAGIFSPVREPRRRMPEYVALIDRRSAQDHQALMFDDFLKRLEQSDVAIMRYHFSDDPRICRRADDPRRQWLLNELTVIHHACWLIICADAELLFDPLTGGPAPWTAKLNQWPHRVLFTSLPPYHWTSREWSLAADGMVVLPATFKGLQLFAELPEQWRIESLFPASYTRAFPSLVGSQGMRWLDRNAPPDDITEKLMGQLRGFLGPSGFSWLCACAVYPEINWSLTRYLAKAVLDGGPDGAHSDFTGPLFAMARLPWFRYGYMPDWLRADLLGQSSPDQENKVRRHLETLLGRMVRQGPRAAGGDGLKVASWITPRDLMATSPRDDSLADTVFVGFMSGARMDRLAIQAPSAFKGLFRRVKRLPRPGTNAPSSLGHRLAAWIRGLGTWHKNVMRLSIACLAGLLALALTIPSFTDVYEVPIETSVYDIAFNPEGTRIAAGGAWDKTIALLDPDSSSQIARFIGHSDHVTSLCFSPDGKILASGSKDKTVRLWDVATVTELAVLKGHTAAIYGVAFSPDGRWLASASGDETVRLWDAGSYAQKAVLTGHGDKVFSVAISADGKTLASGSGDHTIRLWDMHTGSNIGVLAGHEDYVLTVAFSPDAKTLASGSRDKTVRLWDLQTRRQRRVLKGHEGDVSMVLFSPDGKIVASSGSNDRSIRFWDAAIGETVRVLRDFAQTPIRCLAFNSQETALAAGGAGKIFVWPVDMQARKMYVPVPEVLGMLLDAARAALDKAGLNVRVIKTIRAKGRAGTVTAQKPRAGVLVPPGSEVALTQIAGGSYSLVSVPNLVGLRPAEARKILREAGLNLGGTRFGRSPKSPADSIIDQKPPAGAKIGKGSSVTIIVNRMDQSSRLAYCCATASSAKSDRLLGSGPPSVGEVFPSDKATCDRRGGLFFGDQKKAEAICARSFSKVLKHPSPATDFRIIP